MSKKIFYSAVKGTKEISNGYQTGLQALGSNSTKITVPDTRKLNGSVDIDSCVKELYPTENRWDYAIGYNETAYFIEIHPAETSSVTKMIAKVTWLKQWLKNQAPLMKKIKASENPFQWVASGRNAIVKGSKEAHKLSKSGIVITNGSFK